MNITIEQPKVEQITGIGNYGETKATPPAFGQVSAARVNGRANLYGSDFSHNGYVTLSIKGSELRRSLSRDWHFEREQIIEIALSEAQWATLVSSLNNGGGVPCTLMWQQEKGLIPRLPDPEKRVDQFTAEMQEDFADAVAAVDVLKEQIKGMGLSKKRTDELISQADLVSKKLTSSAPFVAEQFAEHMEEEVERAKVEIHGYASQLFQRAGVTALAGEGPLVLTDETD